MQHTDRLCKCLLYWSFCKVRKRNSSCCHCCSEPVCSLFSLVGCLRVKWAWNTRAAMWMLACFTCTFCPSSFSDKCSNLQLRLASVAVCTERMLVHCLIIMVGWWWISGAEHMLWSERGTTFFIFLLILCLIVNHFIRDVRLSVHWNVM